MDTQPRYAIYAGGDFGRWRFIAYLPTLEEAQDYARNHVASSVYDVEIWMETPIQSIPRRSRPQ
jgi:hypothetical protein